MKIKNNRKNKGKKPKKKQEWIDDEVEAKKREGVEKFWEEFFIKFLIWPKREVSAYFYYYYYY